MLYTYFSNSCGGDNLRIDEIVKGAAVEIEVKCNGKTMNFRSDVILVKSNSVLITSIKVNEQTIGFSDKFQINFLYKSEGRLYVWENTAVKLVKYDGAVYHKIDLNGEGKPYNRRDSYRMYIGEDMPLYVNTASGPTALSVLVKDISESGVGFITNDDIDVERTIRLKLKDNNTIISLSGVIVRKEWLTNIGSYLYGCRFNEKNNLLGKYIAKRQNDILKKKTQAPTSRDKLKIKKGEVAGADKKTQ